jgi:nucleotide-binding universal stress UspA family protein
MTHGARRAEDDMTTKILCGIDGRDHSARVVGVGAELAKKLNAQLTLYIVNPSIPGRGSRHPLWSDEYLQRSLSEMKRRAIWLGAPDVACESRGARDVADAILAYADRHEVDYIIVGASGRPGILKLLSGSVSGQVVARADCPVIVVGKARTRRDRDTRRGIPEPVIYRVAAGVA